MRFNQSVLTAIALCAFVGGPNLGCTASAQMGTQMETAPPPPPPPPPDDDGDGILNADDKCPSEKEDGKAPNPNDGCPNLDEDSDNIPVPQDKCPAEPETVNGFEDEDGCPDKKPLVQLVGTRVQINQKIQFKHASAAIEKESEPVLDAVADLMKKHPDIQLVEVSGHASKEGDQWYNRSLTQKRVDSVVKELVKRGVDKARFLSQGYGFYCLLDEGATEEANEKNRRVEFKVLIRDGKETSEKRGCEAAEKAGLKPKALPKEPWKPPAPPATAPASAKADPKAATGKLANPKK
ncbi:MAG: OmpA family protein [Myxococcales bacterium]|nr:OmpA family protein [Myxococcales bacterium]MCB9580653.1 OmpA family protein [Polyangiaceae bacterium]